MSSSLGGTTLSQDTLASVRFGGGHSNLDCCKPWGRLRERGHGAGLSVHHSCSAAVSKQASAETDETLQLLLPMKRNAAEAFAQ